MYTAVQIKMDTIPSDNALAVENMSDSTGSRAVGT